MGSLNAANEVAVLAFLNNKIKFLDINKVIDQTLGLVASSKLESLEDVVANDKHARQVADEVISSYV
jgi:1-deoxy-D-xylulose-5-phosphate reductoisomerase